MFYLKSKDGRTEYSGVDRPVFYNGVWSAGDYTAVDSVGAMSAWHGSSVVSPIEFKLRFTPLEQVAIAQLRKYDGAGEETPDAAKLQAAAVLDVFFSMIDDPRLTEIDLNSEAVIDGCAFCVSIGIITAERMAEITADAEKPVQ